ncbi:MULTISPECIES: NAD-dependent epimerase/dehydratase family protein [unclassified Rathayibacter]|uniref:NAD-dependent epimerase/dehydratase family protein n=1 Tax=unclassified Rathayibacter TaxID=2609250 RepID=UPI0010439497|nr:MULTISPECIES: NAD-dependent epimerase/dehydratase family protein [unclassified Rathayibacter]MCJ1704793.1 GDP-mannose 4,6-dehydratase [Rathayibacter sp. VKM Ac-2926]TCL84591.1 dTDP-glucose 4,6-dehydratase [Rathayibacter sp. PhB192]TCM30309.1 dTDP-glucose 4,6-dehydratase [Rathayibacter sp. PhB179]
MTASRRFLLAGGAGFLGSNLAAEILRRGDEVVVIDDLITGSTRNIGPLLAHPCFSFVQDDAANALAVPGPFDVVLHFASPASPPRYLAHPIETLHAGSTVTEALLEVAKRDGARFVVSSTSEVYGDPHVHPQHEDYWGNVNPNGPRSVYDEAKRYAEAITFAYRRYFDVDTGVVRIFNTYGPNMDIDDGRAVPAFVKAALAGTSIPMHGDGTQTRSLLFVDDLVDGILRMADSKDSGPINLGSVDELELGEIARRIVALVGSDSEIHYEPRPIDDPERRKPDITKAREILGWQPTIPLEDGLARTIAWFQATVVAAP